ncbi:ribose 5-phosphate isomerase B [Candidatus Dependentiae bacterium]|nr:ribose 5-phosphate isomerase B [Candidatus Dependentiae bacterium]
MQIAIGADHGGFQLKEELKKYLAELGYAVKDFGAYSMDPVDYPDIAFLVARSVATGEYEYGIMVDGTGIASSMVANKVRGIRASACNEVFLAISSKEHNNSNMLCLGASVLASPKAKLILKTWIDTPYAGGRHQKRIDKITDIESKFMINI